MIVFTVISGAKNEDPLCYLVEIDDEVRIMLDCGWNDEFNVEDLKNLRRVAKQVDVLLLSHPDLQHLGAYPYAYGHFGLACPVYATLPVLNMGKMCLYDVFQSKINESEFDTFDLNTVDTAFDQIHTLKYSQPISLGVKFKGITITAYAAGHAIGGTIWKIKKDAEEIVYAVDYNHKKERHLDGTVLHKDGVVLDALSRPTLMITDAYNSLIVHPARKLRDTALFETIMTTLQDSGSVLLPTDSSARVLELAYLLDQHWAFHQVSYPLIFLSHQSYNTIKYAKSMLEWMSDAINRQFDNKRENPFEFRYLRLCTRYKELSKYPGPKVVIASNVSLETGYARDLFLEWGTSPDNAVILTDRGPPYSLARKLYYEWEKRSDEDTNNSGPIRKKVPLEGQELIDYISEQRKKQEREAAQAALIAKSRSIIEEDETDGSESELGDNDIEELLSTQFDLYVRDATKLGGFFKQTQSYLMFPYIEKRKRYDEYGELIQADQFKNKGIEGLGLMIDGENGDRMEGDSDDDSDKADQSNVDVPTKYVYYDEEIHFQCQLRFIDLEGTNDGRSLKTIVPQVQPRKLIVVHASSEATHDFTSNCLALHSMTRDIYTPDVGELLNVSEAINFYQVKLTDSLVSSLRLSKLEDYDISFISGKIHLPPDSSFPILDVMPIEEYAASDNPVFVGEIKLTELKRVIQSEGITAEFKGEGVLVCNEKVAIRKVSSNNLIFIDVYIFN
ncbi:19114_t:CDS:2 [Funneliformis geosporum]|uniref:Cleavage and polyadenylation specificity factor subunit 2 n=1 Tax=Funneliformis geosporum TaxID=1117311 RepID=A0A9W4SVA2_9GLOM|nr:19114_t:CDS:2 [Funneliformis geosporum]